MQKRLFKEISFFPHTFHPVPLPLVHNELIVFWNILPVFLCVKRSRGVRALLFSLLSGFQVKLIPRHPDVQSFMGVFLPRNCHWLSGGNSLRAPPWTHCQWACWRSRGPHSPLAWKSFCLFFPSLKHFLLQPLRENSHDFLPHPCCPSSLKVWRAMSVRVWPLLSLSLSFFSSSR